MNCPICHGEMWDNREKKTNPKAPDFKCKDPQCKGVIWPKKDYTPHQEAVAQEIKEKVAPEPTQEIRVPLDQNPYELKEESKQMGITILSLYKTAETIIKDMSTAGVIGTDVSGKDIQNYMKLLFNVTEMLYADFLKYKKGLVKPDTAQTSNLGS